MTDCRPVLKSASIVLGVAIAAGAQAGCIQPHSSRSARSHDHTVRTRTLAWSGGDRLFVGTSADVRYVPGQDAKVVITGPADEIDDIVVDNGWIRHDDSRWRWGFWNWNWRDQPVHIVVTAPQITDAGVGGSGHLDLGRLSQDSLQLNVSGSGAADLSGQFKSLKVSISGSGAERLNQVSADDMSANLSGSGWIKASGSATSIHVSVSGSGAADLGDVAVQDADARVFGSGWAKLSPKQSADISVFGSGSVHLLTTPPRLSTHKAASGSITLPGESNS